MVTGSPGAGKHRCRHRRPPCYTAAMTRPTSTPQSAAITGIILAGGRSSRMAFQDKAWLHWRQRPFIAHIVERLQPQVTRLAISTNNADRFDSLGLPLLADPFAEPRGPLAGILAGLEYCGSDLALFTPCDNPLVSTVLAQRLTAALERADADIAYAFSAASDHYLYALIRPQLLTSLRAFLNDGESAVRRWYAGERVCRVDFDDQAGCFLNINRPDDLQQLP